VSVVIETVLWGVRGAVVTVGGELDLSTEGKVYEALRKLVQAGRGQLILDAEHMSVREGVSLAALFVIDRHCRKVEGWLHIVNASPLLAANLDLAGRADLLGPTPPSFPS
jgi:anti-anti-sigma factor